MDRTFNKVFLVVGCAVLLLRGPALADDKFVIDTDDRLDRYEVSDARLLDLSRAIFTFIEKDKFVKRPDGRFEFALKRTYKQYMNLCDGERFSSQPSPGTFCTGFLVAPDLALTAGHCVEDDELDNFCSKYYLVFDHEMLSAGSPRSVFDAGQIMECSKLEGRSYFGVQVPDYTVIRLAKPAAGRPLLKLSRGGAPQTGARIMAVGYPKGLPKKFVLASKVLPDGRPYFFSTDSDIFRGNSGGPAINARTYEVEGIASHFAGATASQADPDFVLDIKAGCNRTFVCSTADGCAPLNSWTRIGEVVKVVPALSGL